MSKTIQPLQLNINDIRNAIPPALFVKNTLKGVLYLFRDIFLAVFLFYTMSHVKSILETSEFYETHPVQRHISVTLAWLIYWWFQGLVFTGLWVIGHECGHGAFSDSNIVCHSIGFVIHSFLWTPYFSWRISHYRHHANHASMERDEVYVPDTRSELGIPKESSQEKLDYTEYLEDTPLYTLLMLVRQQVMAFPAYLAFNVQGQKHYPRFTNHFDPRSILFRRSQTMSVLVSDLAMILMVVLTYAACQKFGSSRILMFYGIPWLCVSHWFIMITYLHHTAPHIPHYRQGAWTFTRGAAATVDRKFLGWQGRVFLHDVAHFHVVHHFFPKMPFYHGEEATKYLKKVLGKNYLYSDEPIFMELWRSYNECQFVEDEGDIVFYKNKKGEAVFNDIVAATG